MDQVLPDFAHSTAAGSVPGPDVSDVVSVAVAVVLGTGGGVVVLGWVTGGTTLGVAEGSGVGGTAVGVTPVLSVPPGAGVVAGVVGVMGVGVDAEGVVLVGAGVPELSSPQLVNAAMRPVTSQREGAGTATS